MKRYTGVAVDLWIPAIGIAAAAGLFIEVGLGTVAAASLRRKRITRRLAETLRRVFATVRDASRPPRRNYPSHLQYFERARMSREMDRR
jgi:hypothetical protein